MRLPPQPPLGADLTRDARNLAGEGVQLIHHGVHGLLEFQDFTGHIDGDLVRQIAARDGGGHLRDVADLSREIAAHGVHRIGEILPGPRHSGYQRLAAQLTFRTHFSRHARDLRGEGTQLIHHRVDGFLQLQNLAAHVHGNLFRQIAVGNGDGHLRDIAHLRGQIRRHRVHAFREILPNAGHFAHLCLAAQLAVGADLARHARHLGGEHTELLDHGIDDVGGAQKLALQGAPIHIQWHGLQQIAARHRRHRSSDRGRGPQQIVDQRVDRRFHVGPRAVRQAESHPRAGLALSAHHFTDLLELLCNALICGNDGVECVADLARDPDLRTGQAHGKIARLHCAEHIKQLIQIEFRTALRRACNVPVILPSAGDACVYIHD